MTKKGSRDSRVPGAPAPEDNLVVLQDEKGDECSFKILFDSLFVGDKQYVVLMPVEEEDSLDPEIVILRVDETADGESVLSTIDDDDEWEEVLRAFEEMDIDFDVEVQNDEDDDGEPRA